MNTYAAPSLVCTIYISYKGTVKICIGLLRIGSTLTMEHLTEFRTALRHYINFIQKQKVCT